MRIRNIDYRTGQIQAENFSPSKIKLPKNAQEELNYLIAEYFIENLKQDKTKLKFAA